MAVPLRQVDSRPVKLEIVDVQVKNQVCIIKAWCADGSSYHIYRRFKQFDEMLIALEKRFPIEAGTISHKERTLPYLYIAGKKLIGWTAVKDLSDKRLPILNSFLKSIYSLPDNIRYDSIVNHFSNLSPNDLHQPPYTPSQAALDGIPSSCTITRSSTRTSPRTNRRPPTRPQAPPTLKPTHQPPESSRVSPGLPLPSIEFCSISPSIPLPSPKSGRVSPGMPPPPPNSGRVSPGILRPPPPGLSIPPRPQSWIGRSSERREESGKGVLIYYYNGSTRTVEVDSIVFTRPTYVQLFSAIQRQLCTESLVLNYKDSDGDLVQLCGQQDMDLLACEATPSRRKADCGRQAPWAIYVTRKGDNSVYNTKFSHNTT